MNRMCLSGGTEAESRMPNGHSQRKPGEPQLGRDSTLSATSASGAESFTRDDTGTKSPTVTQDMDQVAERSTIGEDQNHVAATESSDDRFERFFAEDVAKGDEEAADPVDNVSHVSAHIRVQPNVEIAPEVKVLKELHRSDSAQDRPLSCDEPQLKRARSSAELDGQPSNETEQSPRDMVRGMPVNLDSDVGTSSSSGSRGSGGDGGGGGGGGRSVSSGASSSDSSENNDSEQLHYPFQKCPSSLEDVAKFILSEKCRKVLILAGAGMSVNSGIPDFRSSNGLYATMDPDTLTADPTEREAIRMNPTIALDRRLFVQNQLPCLEVNREFILGTKSQRWKATLAHRFVELLHAKTQKLARLYTQNIDGLEDQCTQLPPDKVVNVHGSMDRADCAMCSSESNFDNFCSQVQQNIKDITGADPNAPKASTPIPCDVCGYNTMKPSIVLFKSSLPRRFFEVVPQDIEDADLLIVVGTSLTVAPANTIVFRVPSNAMRVVINRDPVGTHLGIQYGSDSRRDFFAKGDIDSTMLQLMSHLGWLDDLKPLLDEDRLPKSNAQTLSTFLQNR